MVGVIYMELDIECGRVVFDSAVLRERQHFFGSLGQSHFSEGSKFCRAQKSKIVKN